MPSTTTVFEVKRVKPAQRGDTNAPCFILDIRIVVRLLDAGCVNAI